MNQRIVSIIGCGWLGLPLAEQLVREGYTVKGSTTSVEKAALLGQKGIDAYALTLNPEPTGNLASLLQANTVVINIPPKVGKMVASFHPQQIQYLVDAIRQSQVEDVIYVSSTSVYPEQNRVVVEEDVLLPEQSASPGLVQAEQLIQQLGPDRRITVLRYAGLMGYDRIPGKYVAGRIVDSGGVPVNYIHRNDAVNVLDVIIQQEIAGVFNAVAPEHPTREAIYRKSCADFGFELPKFVNPEEPVSYKVISPEKLIRATNYVFQYPDPLQFLYQL